MHASRRTFWRQAGHKLWLLDGVNVRAQRVQVRSLADLIGGVFSNAFSGSQYGLG
jgi:hypothetical protein